MGSFDVSRINSVSERNQFYRRILDDLDAFEFLLNEGWVEDKEDMIGAEQEICIIDREQQPLCLSLELLDQIKDERFTNELALYNLEINLDPMKSGGDCFDEMEKDLIHLLAKGQKAANDNSADLFLTGILPTLQFRHLQFDHMTPIERYKLLSDTLLEMRGAKFEILLQGVEDFNVSLDSVLFEACNTSFQTHIQVSPRHFVDRFNWSQMIAGPVLSAATNSPTLFGRELWSETRIALFKQSLDTRGSSNPIRKKLPRVNFGKDWVRESPTELWKNSVMDFPLILKTEDERDWREDVKNGICPELKSVRLHTGTTYNWNRLCYGVHKNSPHIRIECRYIPAGPTVIDEVANFAFWFGLMKGQPEDKAGFWRELDFKEAKDNFIRAARTGINSHFRWFGQFRPARELILEELLPLAENGLSKAGVSSGAIEKYLGVIEKRVRKVQTGSEWQIRNFRALTENDNAFVAAKVLTAQSLEYQKENIPVHEWEDLPSTRSYVHTRVESVEHLMNTHVFAIHRRLGVTIASKIMDWGNFRHLPVEEDDGSLCGVITKNDLSGSEKKGLLVEDLMASSVITCSPTDSLVDAKSILDQHDISCLPVMYEKQLVGILTSTDLERHFS